MGLGDRPPHLGEREMSLMAMVVVFGANRMWVVRGWYEVDAAVHRW